MYMKVFKCWYCKFTSLAIVYITVMNIFFVFLRLFYFSWIIITINTLISDCKKTFLHDETVNVNKGFVLFFHYNHIYHKNIWNLHICIYKYMYICMIIFDVFLWFFFFFFMKTTINTIIWHKNRAHKCYNRS